MHEVQRRTLRVLLAVSCKVYNSDRLSMKVLLHLLLFIEIRIPEAASGWTINGYPSTMFDAPHPLLLIRPFTFPTHFLLHPAINIPYTSTRTSTLICADLKGASTETGFHVVLAQAVWIVRAQDFLKNQTPSVEYALSGIQPFRFAFVSHHQQRIHLPATPAKAVFFPLFFILEISTMTLDALEKDRAPDLEYWLHVELFT
ncbi:hypothetical protein C8R43DRAFT_1170256 [Mycena crocata]|nr:hypothetical protein C8R43DRAFT_1170256 [Mycena crocata]